MWAVVWDRVSRPSLLGTDERIGQSVFELVSRQIAAAVSVALSSLESQSKVDLYPELFWVFHGVSWTYRSALVNSAGFVRPAVR